MTTKLVGGEEDIINGNTQHGRFVVLTVGNGSHYDSGGKAVNQDSVLVRDSGPYTILAVADGVSNSQNGHAASAQVLQTIGDFDFSDIPLDKLTQTMKWDIVYLGRELIPERSSTTLTAVFIAEDGKARCYTVGDSPAFKVSSRVTKLNITGEYTYNMPFQLAAHNHDTYEALNAYVPVGKNFDFKKRIGGQVGIKKPNFTVKEGNTVMVATDWVDKMLPEASLKSLQSNTDPKGSLEELFELTEYGDLQTVLNKPHTLGMPDDVGVIVYKHGK